MLLARSAPGAEGAENSRPYEQKGFDTTLGAVEPAAVSSYIDTMASQTDKREQEENMSSADEPNVSSGRVEDASTASPNKASQSSHEPDDTTAQHLSTASSSDAETSKKASISEAGASKQQLASRVPENGRADRLTQQTQRRGSSQTDKADATQEGAASTVDGSALDAALSVSSAPAGSAAEPPAATGSASSSRRGSAGSSTIIASSSAIKSQLFHQLRIGMKVVLCPSPKLGNSDITRKFPKLSGKVAVIRNVPSYPNTWVTLDVLFDETEASLSAESSNTAQQANASGTGTNASPNKDHNVSASSVAGTPNKAEADQSTFSASDFNADSGLPTTIKVRSSNFRLADKGISQFVQTERLSRSIFFNRLKVGTEIYVLPRPRKQLPKDTDFKSMGQLAVITKVPVYPSTWLTAKVSGTGESVKVRTSQIALSDAVPELSPRDIHEAVTKARFKAAKASQSSRHQQGTDSAEKTKRKRRSSSGTGSAGVAHGEKPVTKRRNNKGASSSRGASGRLPLGAMSSDSPQPVSAPDQGQQQAFYFMAPGSAMDNGAQQGYYQPVFVPMSQMYGLAWPQAPGQSPSGLPAFGPVPGMPAASHMPVATTPHSPLAHSRHTAHGWRPSVIRPGGASHDGTDSNSVDDEFPRVEQKQEFLLARARDELLPSLLNRPDAWPFINPIPIEKQHQYRSAATLQMMYDQGFPNMLNLNIVAGRMQSGQYRDAMSFYRDVKDMLMFALQSFQVEEPFIDVVVEFEAFFDLECTRLSDEFDQGDAISPTEVATPSRAYSGQPASPGPNGAAQSPLIGGSSAKGMPSPIRPRDTREKAPPSPLLPHSRRNAATSQLVTSSSASGRSPLASPARPSSLAQRDQAAAASPLRGPASSSRSNKLKF